METPGSVHVLQVEGEVGGIDPSTPRDMAGSIKISGHPPFPAQVILNGHEYVACQARKAGITFTKEGNCFTTISDAAGLAKIADTLLIRCARSLRRAKVSGSCLVALAVRKSAPANSGHKPLALWIDQPCSFSLSWRLLVCAFVAHTSKDAASRQ